MADDAPSPDTRYRAALVREYHAHCADVTRRRITRSIRPLRHEEEKVLQEAIRIVFHRRVPNKITLRALWPEIEVSLKTDAFSISERGLVQLRPGHHCLSFAPFHCGDWSWLETFVVQAIHVEASALALSRYLGLSAEDTCLATERYVDVARPYHRAVNCTGIFNSLEWWFEKMPHGPVSEEHFREMEERCIEASRRSLETACMSASDVPEAEMIHGPFLLPAGPFAGQALSPEHIRQALVGERFPHLLREAS